MIRITYKSGVSDLGSGTDIAISMPVFGDKPLLVIVISGRATGVDSTPTWNGNNFTQAVTATSSFTFTETAWIYYLVPPAPGTYDVNVQMSGTSYKAQCFLLNDVDQSSPLDTTGSVTGGGSPTEMNPSLTTANNNELVIQVFGDIVSSSGSAQLNGINWNDGQTLLGEAYSGPSGDCFAAGYKVVSTAAATNLKAQMHLNGNTSISQEDIVSVSAAFKQSLSSQPNSSFFLKALYQ